MLIPVKLQWKKHKLWIEADDEKVARSLEYKSTIGNPLLESCENDNEPITLKGKNDG